MYLDIKEMANFRSSGRVIALSWHHPTKNTVICRSSQPKVGILGGRNTADEKMIAVLQDINPGSTFRIIDCRPRLNAMANLAIGGGTESSVNYSDCHMAYGGIDNIHYMRMALHSLYKRSGPNFAYNWLKGLE